MKFLSNTNKNTLLQDLQDAGFEFETEPNEFDILTNSQGTTCIYLGELPKLGTYHANVLNTNHVFATEQPAPKHPYNIFS